jgi:hypothetical protein
MGYTQKYGENRASGIMKTKALSKSSMLFNLGEGSPAKVACGGPLQPPCATVEQVLDAVETNSKYSNAQDVNNIDTMTREQRDEAYANASEDFNYALEDQKISSENLSNLSLAKKVAGRNDPNSEFNYLRSLAMRDRQLRANARIEMDNVKNTLDASDVTDFVGANTTGGLKNKNKKYLKMKYQEYLDKGTDFTSQVDFSAYQNSPKTLSQFTNPTKDKY